jgi:tetratricopeptide (TPR) repeat protein
MRFSRFVPLYLALSVFAFCESVSVEVLDATIKDNRVSGASVILQQSGEQSVKAATNDNGKASLNSRKPVASDTMLIIKKDGFSDLVVKCPCDGLTYALSPVMKNLDGMRIVLSWGKYPEDLDSHLIFSNNHIYFEKKDGNNANLDVDDTDSYGPETITIKKKQFGTNYIYAVHDYTNRERNNQQLSSSGAKVFVYVGQSLVRTYYVPKNTKGNVWKVFSLNSNGEFEDINTMSFINTVNLSEDEDEQRLISHIKADQGTTAASDTGLAYNPQRAKELNKKGENAYHSGDIEMSITYYKEAIENDENFSQAYSNLGLSYQKLNLYAESIWANRKAIALASGANANTIRASSYYNIARLYEQNGEFDEALRHFKLASEQKSSSTYDNAIKRMEEKLQ